MKEQKLKTAKELKMFKFKFLFLIVLVDITAVIFLYFIMPLVQNFPPLSEDFAFQREVQQVTHVQQYMIAFIIGFSIHMISFKVLLRNIYRYLNKYYHKKKITEKEVEQVRKDCINIPYKVFIVQMVSIISIGILFNFIMLANSFAILKFTLMIIAIATLISIIMLIGCQRLLRNVILSTYDITNSYKRNVGYRITNSKNLLFQMIPFITLILIIISLIGYSKAVAQKSIAIANYYKAYIESKEIKVSDVNMSSLKRILDSIPLQDASHYYYIISPGDKEIYVSNPNGSISDFVLSYRDYFYEQSNGLLYEKFGVDEHLSVVDFKDYKGDIWYIGFKYTVIDMDLLVYYLELMLIVIIAYSVLLYIWSKSVSTNLIRTSDSLKDILSAENIDNNKILPITSNDEFGDLAYYYNKIQELTKKNNEQIRNNQETLMERERLASLGQLIGGIAHNLKTPIMSVSGAAEGLKDLAQEYDSSIEDKNVTAKDHHEIAGEMLEWIEKIKNHTEYMSDIITAVKGQAVALASDETVSFTLEELIKRVNILMKHELKNAIVYLNVNMKIDDQLTLNGDVNSLVQVINNMISNSIQAYAGKPEQNIDLTITEQDNCIVISIQDYACGMSKEIQKKLFKEMVTTKGKNGTGLGLFMSYSNIRAHFNGNITFESEKGKGTKFYIILPIQK